jgi:hypothetical protein
MGIDTNGQRSVGTTVRTVAAREMDIKPATQPAVDLCQNAGLEAIEGIAGKQRHRSIDWWIVANTCTSGLGRLKEAITIRNRDRTVGWIKGNVHFTTMNVLSWL